MKNRQAAILMLITCMFAAFTLGFLLGRTTAPGDTIITQITRQPPAETQIQKTQASVNEIIELPTIIDTETAPPVTDAPSRENTGRININTATAAQLETLPGIGPVLAQRIIDYRTANGPFTAIGQLMQVDGIGEKRLAAILDLITIE